MQKSICRLTVAIALLSWTQQLYAQDTSLANSYFHKALEFKKNMYADSALVYFEYAALAYQKQSDFEKYLESCNQMGIVLTRQDKYDKARYWLEKALADKGLLGDSMHLTLANTYINLGVVYNAEGKFTESLAFHNKALLIRLHKLGSYHADVATSYGNIGNVCRNNKAFDESIVAHMKAMEIREKLFGASSAEIVESYAGLGNAYREKKDYETARMYFEKALTNKILQRGDGHKDLVKYYKYLSEVCYLQGDIAKGDAYKAQWEKIEKG